MEIRNKREGTMPGLAKKEKKSKNIGYLPNPYKTKEKKEDYYIEDITICNLYEIAKKISDKNKIYYQKGKKIEQINNQNTYIIIIKETSFYCKETNEIKYYIGCNESATKTFTYLYKDGKIYHLKNSSTDTYNLTNEECSNSKHIELHNNEIIRLSLQNKNTSSKRKTKTRSYE